MTHNGALAATALVSVSSDPVCPITTQPIATSDVALSVAFVPKIGPDGSSEPSGEPERSGMLASAEGQNVLADNGYAPDQQEPVVHGLFPYAKGGMFLVMAPQQRLTWEQSSAVVLMAAALTDGAVIDISQKASLQLVNHAGAIPPVELRVDELGRNLVVVNGTVRGGALAGCRLGRVAAIAFYYPINLQHSPLITLISFSCLFFSIQFSFCPCSRVIRPLVAHSCPPLGALAAWTWQAAAARCGWTGRHRWPSSNLSLALSPSQARKIPPCSRRCAPARAVAWRCT